MKEKQHKESVRSWSLGKTIRRREESSVRWHADADADVDADAGAGADANVIANADAGSTR